MNTYNEVSAARKIQRSSLLITLLFYILIFGALILGTTENILDYFPNGILNFMDELFKETPHQEKIQPQAFSMISSLDKSFWII